MLNIILLITGFAVLVYAAGALVDSASCIAKKLNIPEMVIGLTIVAFGTSAPEMVVNIFASVSGNPEIVLGNVLGSNIFNILGILGISAVIFPLTVKSQTTWIEIPLAVLAAVAVLVLASDKLLDSIMPEIMGRADGYILLMFFTIFLAYNISVSKSGATDESIETKDWSMAKSALFFVLGLSGLILGGKLIVDSAVSIGRTFGLSERIIGLTIVSIGTSLPELATSVTAVLKKNVDIAIGNVVGSNIFNTFFILGVSATIKTIPVNFDNSLDMLVNLMASLLLFVFIFTGKGRKIERWEGVVFLVAYFSYIGFLVYS